MNIIESLTPEFKLGDIVVTKSTFCFHNNNWKIHHRSFNHPLMIIKEINVNPRHENLFDAQTGKRIADEIKYLCHWYNAEKGKFEECWFFQSLLLKIEHESNNISISHIEFGMQVSIVSHSFEFKKRLHNVRLNKNEETVISDSSNFLWTFLPPIFTVKGFKKAENFKICDNQNPQRIVKESSEYLVKCVWYNDSLAKFSEELIPIESLMKIEPPL